MIKFYYKAKNNKGEVATGTVRANNAPEAEQILIKHNLVPSELIPEQGKPKTGIMDLFSGKVKVKDKAIFSRELATMLGAGLSLTKAINLLVNQSTNKQLKQVFSEVYRDLEEGFSFSSALSKHPKVFDQVYVSVVNSGESTGKLDVVLNELAEELENDSKFVGQIRGALYYPGFIFLVLIAAAVLVMIYVVPQIKAVFSDASVQLPLMTRILIGISNFVIAWWWAILLVLIAIILGVRSWAKTPAGKYFFAKLAITTPGIKKIVENISMYRFTRVLSMLTGAGVPLLDALKTSSAVVDNMIYEESVVEISRQVEKGVSLSSQLLKDKYFPALVGNMVSVGEETGELDKVLAKVSKYYESSTAELTKAVSSLVEPAVLILVGIAVAVLVFAIYLPIFQLAGIIK